MEVGKDEGKEEEDKKGSVDKDFFPHHIASCNKYRGGTSDATTSSLIVITDYDVV